MTEILEKERHLKQVLHAIGSCVVAFSGGVDSAYLAVVAQETLGARARAITAESPSYPADQRRVALEVVRRFGLRHDFIESGEMADPDYVRNPVNRCYFCKTHLYGELRAFALHEGFDAIVDGTNLDDTADYRPGRAAAAAFAVRSPLVEVGLRKADIRALSRMKGLPTWDQPASACLASRIPYGSEVTAEKLRMIEHGEAFLRSLGIRQSRVRHHGEIVRIEVGRDELEKVMKLELFDRIAAEFKTLGFRFVALDLEGYRTGALNGTRPNEVPGR